MPAVTSFQYFCRICGVSLNLIRVFLTVSLLKLSEIGVAVIQLFFDLAQLQISVRIEYISPDD